MLCEFDGRKCKRCGFVKDTHGRVYRRCRGASGEQPAPEPPTSPPPIGRQVANYAKAVTRWKRAGSPERTDGEVRRIFDEVCTPCQFFNAAKETCNVCGCRVRQSGAALLNKIKMGTERCPKGKWEAIT